MIQRDIDHYELTLDVHGPHYHDKIDLRAPESADLRPRTREIGDIKFEFYPNVDDEGYVEVRTDYVVARELRVVYRDRDGVDDTRREPRLPAMVGALDRESTSKEER